MSLDTEDAQARPKSKNIRPLWRLFPFLLPYKRMTTAAAIALVIAAAATLYIPIAFRRVIDDGFSSANPELISQTFLTCIWLAFLLAIATASRFYAVTWLGERIVTDLRQAVFAHVLSLEPAFFEKVRTGEVISRLSADTTLIRTVLASSASVALRNSVLLIGAIIMMLISSPFLSSLTLLIIPLIALPLLAMGRVIRNLSRRAQDKLAYTGAFAAENISAIKTLQSLTYEDAAKNYFQNALHIAFNAAKRRILARALLTAFIIFLVLAAVAAVLWRGAHDVLEGTISAGLLGQFIFYAVLASASLASLGEVWGEMQLAAGASSRLFELIDSEPKIKSPARPKSLPPSVQGHILFDNVSFAYPSRPEIQAVKNISFEAKPDEIVALVGPSGGGKSTLLYLLERFEDPLQGRILLDGVDIRDLDPILLRRQYATVLQDTVLFSMSIAENIRYGLSDISDEAIEKAARAAQAHDFIVALPEGYETVLGERGQTLSGGQQQRVAIARALLRAAPVLLLDEATSALDSENEVYIQKALDHLSMGRTTFVIAHRLSTVRRAQHIIVMDRGEILNEGTHESLMGTSALYRRLVEMQLFQDSTPDAGGSKEDNQKNYEERRHK